MPLFSPDSNAATPHAGIRSGQLLVACLCTEWCGMCRSYRTTSTELVQWHPECRPAWVDVEDHVDVLGDFDVENLPILLVQRGSDVLFSGPALPHAGIVERLISRDLGVAPAVLAVPDLRGWLSESA